MSEYQYFEFQAVDKPLSEKEMRELRSYSTRAQITPTSFVNEYNWGDFKGDENTWMEKYFDAFLYFANWGTRILKLRLPSRLLDPKTAEVYCCGESSNIRVKSGKVILNFAAEDIDEIYDLCEDDFTLASLLPVRAELASGDLRALYLGWLLCAQNGEFDDDEDEPPVPPGLGHLSASLENLVDFLCIDRDLFYAASQRSSPIKEKDVQRKDVKAWVAALPSQEKDRILTDLIAEHDSSIVAELVQRFIHGTAGTHGLDSQNRRTVGELLQATEAHAEERKRIEAEKRAEEKARREREAIIAREKYLDGIADQAPKLWTEVDNLIATRQPNKYDLAVKILMDLHDLDQRFKKSDFNKRLDSLRQTHLGKPSLIKRLNKAGL